MNFTSNVFEMVECFTSPKFGPGAASPNILVLSIARLYFTLNLPATALTLVIPPPQSRFSLK